MKEKECSQCLAMLQIIEENFSARNILYVTKKPICKKCQEANIKAAKWRYHDKNREEQQRKSKERIDSNPAANRKYHRDYYHRNKNKIRARVKARAAQDPEKERERRKKRKALRRGAEKICKNPLTRTQWEFIKNFYHHRCCYCGNKPKKLTQDHITPVSHGGPHSMENILPACVSCNSKKHNGKAPIPVQPFFNLGL